jgi:hypothetical protein
MALTNLEISTKMHLVLQEEQMEGLKKSSNKKQPWTINE